MRSTLLKIKHHRAEVLDNMDEKDLLDVVQSYS